MHRGGNESGAAAVENRVVVPQKLDRRVTSYQTIESPELTELPESRNNPDVHQWMSG